MPSWRLALLQGLFLLSGLTALVYEIVWFKRFAHVWGSAPLAMAAVVASFLLGLGIGAHRIGRLADRIRRPLSAYGACELAIGVLALLVPLELAALAALGARVHPFVVEHPLAGSFLRCLATFVVLGPPCVLMGGTLPLLVKAACGQGLGVGRSVGTLYAVNAVGAALGAYLAGFHLLPALGIQATTFLAVGLNVLIALASFAFGAELPSEPVAAPEPDPRPASRPWLTPGMAFATGGAALVLQMVWYRQMALIVGGSTYAFTAVLVVILLGIGLGSLGYRSMSERYGDHRRLLQAILAFVVVTTVLSRFAAPVLVDAVSLTAVVRASIATNAAVCMLAGGALAFLPSLGFGALFPAIVAVHHRTSGTEGRTVGGIYWWNTFGCIAGATLTPLVLIPALGTHVCLGIATGLCCLAFALAYGTGTRPRPLQLGAALPLGLGAIYLAALPVDPLRMNMGRFWSGYVPPESRTEELLFFAEGSACNVLVTGGAGTVLRLNGKADAGDRNDMPAQLGCAYMPKILRPRARDVFVLGLGSGTTAGAALLFPDTRVTCCEIEQEVLPASRLFAHVNHEPYDSPRFEVLFIDGRSHLQGTDESYDVIVLEPSNPWVAGIGNLFTREFYAAARDRLRSDGLLLQWVQTYQFAEEDYALVLRTLSGVFEHCGIIRIDESDTLVVASDGDLVPPASVLAEAQGRIDGAPAVVADLDRWFGTHSVGRLLARHFVVGPDGVRALLDAVPERTVITDDNLRLEFDSPHRLFDFTPRTDAYLLGAVDGAWQRHLLERAPDRAGSLLEWRGLFHVLEGADVASRTVLAEHGYEVAPEDPFFLMRETLERPPAGDAFRERVVRLAEASPEIVNRLGARFWARGEYEHATLVFEVMLAKWPDSATTWANLSVSRDGSGLSVEAAEALLRALEIDPLNGFATRTRDSKR